MSTSGTGTDRGNTMEEMSSLRDELGRLLPLSAVESTLLSSSSPKLLVWEGLAPTTRVKGQVIHTPCYIYVGSMVFGKHCLYEPGSRVKSSTLLVSSMSGAQCLVNTARTVLIHTLWFPVYMTKLTWLPDKL